MMKRRLIVFLGICLAPTVAAAQQGVLRVKATDTVGGLLPGVSVEVCGPGSGGECRIVDTNVSGYSFLDDLVPGTYTVTLSLPGFITRVHEDVEVVVGDDRYLLGQLAPGPLAGEVTREENALTVNAPANSVLGPGVGSWVFDGAAGQVVSVAAASDAFDPEAELRSPTGEHLASDDDSGPGVNAFLVTTLPVTGRYEVRVRAIDGGTGAYHLAVRTVAEAGVALDTPVTGALDDRSPVGRWTFDGAAGQVVSVAAASGAFDPAVELSLPNGHRLEWDDDSASALAAAMLPVAGPYKVTVRAVDGGAGAYDLAVRTVAVAEAGLALGIPVTGVLDDRVPVGKWAFDGAAGDVVSVVVASEAFFPEAEVLLPTGGTLTWDNTGAPGANVLLTATLPATGRYTVGVRAVYGGAGPYRLAVATVGETRLTVGTPVTGVLDDRAAVGRWTFDGTAGDAVSVAVAAEAFDPTVELRLPNGERAAISRSLGNESLTTTLPVTGRYEVRVRPSSGGTGAYQLAVRTVGEGEASLAVDTPVTGGARELALGARVTAMLADEAPVGRWTFDGTAGQVVSVAAAAEAFDPAVDLRWPTGERPESDDDSGPGISALLHKTLPVTGRYELRVYTVDGETGSYRVVVDTVAKERLVVDTPVSGTLDDRSPVEVWEFEGAAGQVLRIAARSDAFAPAVELRSSTGERVGSLESGATGSDAWLTARLPAAGRYQAWVREVDAGTGPYHLTVRTSAPHELALDTPVTAELGEGPVGVWTFDGAAGQVLRVAPRSDAFAPVVEVWSSSGDRVPWDDPPAAGADAGRGVTLPADGGYEVRVRADDGGTGAYQVAVGTTSAPDMAESAAIARVTAPAASEVDIARLADGHRTFAFDLHQALRGASGNLIYSPYSLSLSFGMLAAGARGDTARQIAETLHFRLPPVALHPAVNALDLAVRSGAGSRAGDAVPAGRAYQLAIANALWSQQGSSILPAYLDILGRYYGASLKDIDFRRDPNAARRRINNWVRGQTDGHVPELFAAGEIRNRTQLVLANAVAFEARWESSFDEPDTTGRPFHLRDGARIETPTMRGDIDVGYAAQDGYQVIDMPYKGGAAAMTVLVPDAGHFDRFERRLDADLVEEAIAGMEDTTVSLFLPRFVFETTVPVTETLAGMGMPDAFDPARADLSGINAVVCPAEGCLYVDTAAHMAFVSVDEEGTKAAAASGAGMMLVSGRPLLPAVRIDRPFVFLIRDVLTDTVLFVGRVLDPSLSE